MTTKASSDRPVPIPPDTRAKLDVGALTAEHEARIRAANPHLTERESETVWRLARLYVMLHARADASPVSVLDGDVFQKLAALALRHEAALGITKTAPDAETPDALPSIRRKG